MTTNAAHAQVPRSAPPISVAPSARNNAESGATKAASGGAETTGDVPPARAIDPRTILNRKRIAHIVEMMSACSWHARFWKDLALKWFGPDALNPENYEASKKAVRRLSAKASKIVVRDAKKNAEPLITAGLQKGLQECIDQGRWQDFNQLAQTMAKIAKLDQESSQVQGPVVQVVQVNQTVNQVGESQAFKMLMRPRPPIIQALEKRNDEDRDSQESP